MTSPAEKKTFLKPTFPKFDFPTHEGSEYTFNDHLEEFISISSTSCIQTEKRTK